MQAPRVSWITTTIVGNRHEPTDVRQCSGILAGYSSSLGENIALISDIVLMASSYSRHLRICLRSDELSGLCSLCQWSSMLPSVLTSRRSVSSASWLQTRSDTKRVGMRSLAHLCLGSLERRCTSMRSRRSRRRLGMTCQTRIPPTNLSARSGQRVCHWWAYRSLAALVVRENRSCWRKKHISIWMIELSTRTRSWSWCLPGGLRQRRKVERSSTGLSRGPSSGASPDWHANAGRRPSWVRWPTATPSAGRGSRRLTMNIDVSVAVSEKSCFRQAPTRTGCAYGGALTNRCRGRHFALVAHCGECSRGLASPRAFMVVVIEPRSVCVRVLLWPVGEATLGECGVAQDFLSIWRVWTASSHQLRCFDGGF